MSNSGSQFLVQLLWVAPAAAVQLLAILWGFVNMNRAPRPALLLIAAGSVLLLSSLGGTLARNLLLSSGGFGPGGPSYMLFMALNVVQSLVTMAGYSTIVIAVFLDRAPAAAENGAQAPSGYGGPPRHSA